MPEGGEAYKPDQSESGNYVLDQAPLEMDREAHRQRFEHLRQQLQFGATEATRRNEDGSETTLVSYESRLSVADEAESLAGLRLSAAAAGMKEAATPMVLPFPDVLPPAYVAGKRMEPATFVQLIYEKP